MVETNSDSSPTNLHFARQPIDSDLMTECFNKFHTGSISLAPEFEGEFDLASAFNRPMLVIPEKSDDPSGRGRRRVVKFVRSWVPWCSRGTVAWVKEGLQDSHADEAVGGTVRVTSIGAPALLSLG